MEEHRSTGGLPVAHLLLGVCAAAVWGSSFSVIRVGLDYLPPLLLACLRFAFAFFPAALFVRRPGVAWTNLAAFGLLIGAGQFGLLYLAMLGHISPGLASVVIQVQVFFTIGLAMLLAGEQVRAAQAAALLLAAGGIVLIAAHAGTATATPLGLALVLLAALSWAVANLVLRRNRGVDMLAYMVWSSLFAAAPLFALSWAVEGWPAMADGLRNAGWAAWASVAWQSAGNTLFAYAVWGWLLARHPAALVTPLALLVPVFGMGTAALWLDEPLPAWKVAAALLVIAGLAVGFAPARLFRWVAPRRA